MALKFKQDFSAIYGEAEDISPLIRRVLCENPSPYTYTGTGTYIVGKAGDLAVIDPGPEDSAHGDAILAAAGGHKISTILVTHSHIDHSPLSAWLAEQTGATILAYGPHGAGRKGGLEGEEVEAGADWDFKPHKLLRDGDTVSGKDWSFTAFHTPGHTANHMCFLLKEENTLFVGDHIMGWATTVISPPDGDMRDYLTSLRTVEKLAPDMLLPTHGPAVTKSARFVRGIIAHRRMREGQILKLLTNGPTTIAALVKIMYKSTDIRLHPAAARSVFGHLLALVDEKRVECEGPPLLSSEYFLPEAG